MLHMLAVLAQQQANPGKAVGQGIEDILRGFSGPVYLGILAVGGLGLAHLRKYSALWGFLGVMLVLGILSLAPETFGNLATSIGSYISKRLPG